MELLEFCPYCGEKSITDTLHRFGGITIARRRCNKCDYTWKETYVNPVKRPRKHANQGVAQ